MSSAEIGALKDQVRGFWDRASCGEVYARGESARDRYEAQRAARYALEPYIAEFARFHEGAGKDVLEIGVGMGADHAEWAAAGPRSLTGIDLTPRAVDHTRARFDALELTSRLLVADAENLPFSDGSFDLVYSWGVLHHSPDTPRAIREVQRVLRPGGRARVMIYHRHSIVGFMLWARYALLAGKPWTSLDAIYANHLESPGTKAYSVEDARRMFAGFRSVETRVLLSFGDLLQGEVGQRHGGPLLRAAKAVWPRALIQRALPDYGLTLLIDATK